jgi:hypothetical protein
VKSSNVYRIAVLTKEMAMPSVLKVCENRSAKDEKDRHLCFCPG